MKYNKIIKRLSTSAMLISILASAVSCGASEPAENPLESESQNTMEITETAENELIPPVEDFGGGSFRILVSDDVIDDYYRPEENGEIVNDAIVRREQTISERLNVFPEYVTQPGSFANKDIYNTHIASTVMAGESVYDMIIEMTVMLFPIAAEGYFCDLAELKSLSLDAPWWMNGLTEHLGINGKLYGALGDASLSFYTHINVMYFNQQLIDNYDFPNPYETVRNGDWTIDCLMDQCKGLGADINGSGTIDNEDFFGFLSIRVPARALQTSLGLDLIAKNDEGIPVLLPLSEKITDVLSHMRGFFAEGRDALWELVEEKDAVRMFSSGQSLYLAGYLYNTASFRDMKDDFGIIPYPKYDKSAEYHTQIGTTTQVFTIPVTAQDPEKSAVFLDQMGYESAKNVIPSYYEVTLKDKYARDEQVREMLDLIRASAKMDFAFAYNMCFSPQFSMFLTDILSPQVQNNPVSYYEKNRTAWESQLKTISKNYQ